MRYQLAIVSGLALVGGSCGNDGDVPCGAEGSNSSLTAVGACACNAGYDWKNPGVDYACQPTAVQCTCNMSSACETGCDCDLDCCTCDTSSTCETGCDCDLDCCSCDTSSTCETGCDCDVDCIVCRELFAPCTSNDQCCASAPTCGLLTGCCVGSGTRDIGSYCSYDFDCCSGTCGDDDECCLPQDVQCASTSDCCSGLACGSAGSCCPAIGAYCGSDPTCCPSLSCSDIVVDLGGGSSTTESDHCCVPGGGYCSSDEHCCIEDPDITGVQCYDGRCRRSYGSPCTNDDQCTWECVDGFCD